MKKLLVLFISLFIMVNGAVFAQETDDKDESQDVVTGSVSTSEYYAIPSDVKPGEIQPMQVNGGIEALAELYWQINNGSIGCTYFTCWMQGKATTRIQNAAGNFYLCAEVDAFWKNNTNLGGTGNCNTYSGNGNGVTAQMSQNGEPRGNSWAVWTEHSANSPQISWYPFLTASVQL
jgi:hypothetical protein